MAHPIVYKSKPRAPALARLVKINKSHSDNPIRALRHDIFYACGGYSGPVFFWIDIACFQGNGIFSFVIIYVFALTIGLIFANILPPMIAEFN
jgi:hypothetical protein